MALFKVNRGNEANLPSKLTDGWAYFCTDTGSFLIDHYDSTNTLVRSKVNAEYADMLRYVQNGETVELTPEEIITALSNKVDKINGKGLSTNDYTTAEKTKLDGIEDGANKTIVDSAMSSTSTNPVQNKVVQAEIDTLQANIDTHANNTDNPHNVTIDQIGAAAVVHEHDAGTDITSGILPALYGGTGNDSGYVRIGQKSGTKIGSKATVEGYDNTASEVYSHAEGWGSTASGSTSHAEGRNTQANGFASHAEGRNTIAGSAGDPSTTNSVTAGYYTHAEGYGTVAIGIASHAEGQGTKTIGPSAHAEGYMTEVTAEAGHAEGYQTSVSGMYGHAEGIGTVAYWDAQHVQGKYNVIDQYGDYIHIVGNGYSESSRRNVHTIDLEGDAWFAGDVYVGGSSQSNGTMLASTMPLTTAEYETMSANNELKESTLYMLTDDTYEEDLQATVDGMNNIDYDTYLAFDTTEIV